MIKGIFQLWKDMKMEFWSQVTSSTFGTRPVSDEFSKIFSLNDIDELIENLDEQYKRQQDTRPLTSEILTADFKDNQPISELGGWHKEPPTEDCTVLLYTETQFHKNAPYVIAEWDNHAQCFYDEANDEPISEWIKWKRL